MIFNDIIGNDNTKEYLKNSIINKNILHSYLFLGTDGIGKKEFAIEFAKSILCENSSTSGECTCKSCLCFDGKNHPDFNIINENNEVIKIEQIRELIEKVYEKPITSSKKIYIINNADQMTVEAQNCLLKILEEPPEFLVFILISSNDNLILNTIKSRCTIIKFKNLDNNIIKDYAKENVGLNTLSNNMLFFCNGSIGKIFKLQESYELFGKVEDLFNDLDKGNLINFLNVLKAICAKEKIYDILDFIEVCLFSNSKEKPCYINCIEYVSKCKQNLKNNCNYDITLDMLVFDIWGEINDNRSRC